MILRPSDVPDVRTPPKRARRVGLIALGGLVVWAVAGAPFIVFPHVDPLPKHADVAFVLGPATAQRIDTAQRLLDEGRVDTVLWSTPNLQNTASNAWVAEQCATRAHLICEAPDPGTTQGEARILRREAASHNWTSAIVITMTPHLTRARTIMARCFSGSITMRPSGEPPARGWIYQYLYQTTSTIKAWIRPGC